MAKKSWTGERLETQIAGLSSIEHLHRYGLALALVKNKKVLDIASGEGYGSNLLAKEAANVIGVDISKEAVEDAKNKYIKPNLEFKVGSTSNIPVDSNSIDVVISFETIEHHAEHEKMMEEIKRVLKPDGLLFISSPDKKFYSDIPNYNNPFHVKELYFDEFKALISKSFKFHNYLLQKIIIGSLIVNENEPETFLSFDGNYQNVTASNNFNGVYNICIASNHSIPHIPSSAFGADDNFEAMRKATFGYKIAKFFANLSRVVKK